MPHALVDQERSAQVRGGVTDVLTRTGTWVADLSRGKMILNAQLPRVSVGGLTLRRDGGSVGGPLFKMVASVLDRKVRETTGDAGVDAAEQC